METLASMLTVKDKGDLAGLMGHSKPARTLSVTVEEMADFESSQREADRRRRLKAASIPAAYASASTKNCSPAIKEYAARLDAGETRGLVMRGAVGVGKTYAACAILNHVADWCTVRFATMGDIIAEIRGTYGTYESELDVIGKYRNVRVLVIDDLGKEKPTAFVLEKIFAIIDGRYRADKPTIITTQYSARQLAERLASEGDYDTAEAIVSRLQESHAVLLEGGDRRSQAQ